MNIGFDAKRAYLNRSGLGNYSRNLIKSLINYFPENHYTLFTTLIESSRFHLNMNAQENVSVIAPNADTNKIFHSLWRTFKIPSYYKDANLDIYHGLSAELPSDFLAKKKIKKVITVHDLIFLRYPELYNNIDSSIYNKKTRSGCKSANSIVAISEQTKIDLIEFFKVDEQKIKVVYQSCDPIFYNTLGNDEKDSISKIYKLPQDYILYVGTVEERKNVLSLIKVLKNFQQKIEIPLVIIGKKKAYFNEVQKYINLNKLSNKVIFLDSIPTNVLPALYQNAKLFVYPSLFEGFGIPIIEALFSRIPVITSKDSCFEEAGGKGTIYVNPLNIEELGYAIENVLGNTQLANTMVKDGAEFVQKFRDVNTSNEMMKIYNSLM
jgi:glycosyltransferase involved in cell wall biosynthesis